MAVEASGELGEDRVFGVGGDPLDDQLVPGDAEGQGPPLAEELDQAPQNPSRSGLKGGVTLGVHRVLVEGDRQLDQEFPELPREGGLGGAG